jgi:hypothetical protein
LRSEQIDLCRASNTPVDLPEALLRRWEESYQPHRPGFDQAFSAEELRQLGCFTDFLLARMSSFPKELDQLLKDPYWNAVCQYAWQLLEDLSARAAKSKDWQP